MLKFDSYPELVTPSAPGEKNEAPGRVCIGIGFSIMQEINVSSHTEGGPASLASL